MNLTQSQVEQKIIWETENLLIEKAENEEFSTRRSSPTDYALEYEFAIHSSDHFAPNTDSVTFFVPLEVYNECFEVAQRTVKQEIETANFLTVKTG
jgi:hypothetical protein